MMVLLSILAPIVLVAGVVKPAIAASRHHRTVPVASSLPPPSYRDIQPAYEAVYASESANWLVGNISTDPFYQSPSNISAYAPGDTLRLERVSQDGLSQYKIPPGLSLYRMLYQSVDLDGRPVPASAFILLPYARPASTPLKLIVWTHGTSGIERQCAPSNQRNLYYDFDGSCGMALRGYAVIAPDYAGLGSDTTFNYLAGPSHAADVAYSVLATRRALPHGLITHEWVVVGHSEGGLTAWATNEREVTQPIGGFLGAVSLAPALENLHILRYGLAHNNLRGILFYAAYTLSTIARLDKSVDVTRYFSDVGLERSRLAATACYDTAAVVFANLTFADIFKDQTWMDSSWAVAWEDRTAVRGEKPLAKPLLVIEGLGDTAVNPAIPESVFANHCARQKNTRAHLSRYPGMGHDAVAFASQFEYFDWIADRFHGVETPTGCTNATVTLVNDEPDSNYALVVQS